MLQSVVGPGDLLSSDLRADFAAEAYAAWGDCPGCIKAKLAELPSNGENFAKFNEEEWLGEERWVQCIFRYLFSNFLVVKYWPFGSSFQKSATHINFMLSW